jgi:hypothetical protein
MTESKVAADGRIWYKNSFPDLVENEWLTVGMFIRMLFTGMPYDELPDDVASAVDAEMTKRVGMPKS